jgi:hypothetical protein
VPATHVDRQQVDNAPARAGGPTDVMGVGARLSRVAHAAVSPGTRTSSQAAHGTSGPVRRLCNITVQMEQVCGYTTRGCCGCPGWRSRALGVPGCMGRKGGIQCLSLVARRGPTWSAATIWRGFSTRPGWRGGHREEPRAIRDGCGRRRQGVQTRRHVSQGNPFTLRHPSAEENAVKEGL